MSIRSLRGRGRGRRSLMRNWWRWRSARRRCGVSSDRQFLGLVGYRLPGWFPHLPEQSQYNRRLRSLTGLLSVVQQRLAGLLDVGGPRLADGTLIGVANYAGCAARSEFAGSAAYGFCAAKSEWVWGVRLVLRTDRRGLPLGYTLVPANEKEYEPLLDLVDQGETVIADKGLWGRAYNAKMESAEVRLLTPSRERSAANAERERTLAGMRLTIESVFSNLKEQMRLGRHLAKTPRGLAQRIAQRLLALTLGIYCPAWECPILCVGMTKKERHV